MASIAATYNGGGRKADTGHRRAWAGSAAWTAMASIGAACNGGGSKADAQRCDARRGKHIGMQKNWG